ncbi:MAG: LPS assembly lipoprotein LptE [Alphaproteobacteria bacterium]
MWWFEQRGTGRLIASALIACGWIAALAGCGFHPLYGKANPEVTAQAQLIKIGVRQEGDPKTANFRIGQQLRNTLLTQLTPYGEPAQPQYYLDIKMTESTENLAIQKNQVATRANLQINATYILRHMATGGAIFSGQARGVASYDVVQSEYANLAAEQDAERRSIQAIADDITLKISFHFTQKNPTEPVATRGLPPPPAPVTPPGTILPEDSGPYPSGQY